MRLVGFLCRKKQNKDIDTRIKKIVRIIRLNSSNIKMFDLIIN